MIDRIAALPLPVRHLLLALLAAVLTWTGTDLVPLIDAVPPPWAGLLGLLVAGVLAWATPLVQGYGFGTRKKSSGAITVDIASDPEAVERIAQAIVRRGNLPK